jgi:hypothetical protein
MPRFVVLLVVFAGVLPVAAQESNGPSRNLIGVVKAETGGCGCYFGFASREKRKLPATAFWSDLEETGGLMNIDGQDVRLELVKTTAPTRKPRVGARWTELYRANGITVSIVYVVTRVCGRNEEDCEVTNYNGTFTVKKGKRQQTLTLRGGCGC